MYIPVDFFNHEWHSSDKGANIKCNDCHTTGVTRNIESAKKCVDCHTGYEFSSYINNNLEKYYAPSYTDALHKLCVSCHTIKSIELTDKTDLAQCTACHKTKLPEELDANLKWETTLPHFNNVILPDIDLDKNEKE